MEGWAIQASNRIAIVDDCLQDREALSVLVRTRAQQRGLCWELESFASGEALLRSSSAQTYDLIFLDILMPGLDGLETARRLRAGDSVALLVFVTTEADFALEGYEVEAAGFLLKAPNIDPARFARLMGRLERRMGSERALDLSPYGIPLHLPLGNVLYAEVLGHRMLLHTQAGAHSLRLPLEELKPRLDHRFFECHRGILINLDKVVKLDGDTVTLVGGDTLPVSRRRRKALMEAYAAHSVEQLKRGG